MSRRPKVLVIDDKYYIRQLLITALGLKGYEVIDAANGPDGLAKAAATPPDVILLDLLMPGVDGYQVLESLRRNPVTSNIPVIIMSAKTEAQGAPETASAVDYLIKPFDLEVMEEMVERYAPSTEVAATDDAATDDAATDDYPF